MFAGPDDRAVLEPVHRRRPRRARCRDHQQAQIIAYIDDYKLLMIATLVAIPLVLLLRKSAKPRGVDHSLAVE